MDVAVYPVMAEPPVFDGAVNATLAVVSPPVAAPTDGAPGTVAEMVALIGSVAVARTLSVAVSVTLIAVSASGVPVIAPVVVLKLAHEGSVPVVTATV